VKRIILAGLGVALVAGAVFIVPTVWFTPWSIDHLFLRMAIEAGLDSPQGLSLLRVLEPYGIDFHNDDLDDYSVEHTREVQRRAARDLETLRSYAREGLSAGQRLSYDVIEWSLQQRLDGEEFLFHDHPLNQFSGVQSSLFDFMLNIHQITDVESAEDYIVRLSKFDTALDQTIAAVQYRAERGVIPPRFVLDRVSEQVQEIVATPVEESALFTRMPEALAEFDARGRDQALLAGTRAALEDAVYPAYRRVLAVLEELAPKASDDAGAWSLPKGEAYYAWRLRGQTTTDLTPAEVHAIGVAEVRRISAEMLAILGSEGIDAESLAEGLTRLDADPRQRYADVAGAREQILADFQALIDDAQARLPDLFGILPGASVEARRVPPFREEGSAFAYYNPPAMDGSRPGVFYANLRRVGDVRRYRMRSLTYHEAVPGHHLQIALAMENEAVPLLRRVTLFTAFIEGWGLYAEQLAAEQGFHATPLDRLGQLNYELFRAVRLVVDTGIHAERWTREQAIDYMVENTGMPAGEVVPEVERYIVTPGQACAYKIGQLKILEVRESARSLLGERFDLREFHDVVLGNAHLPLEILEGIVQEWATGPT
jgi:uncharacterized protein (DUF885 family)